MPADSEFRHIIWCYVCSVFNSCTKLEITL